MGKSTGSKMKVGKPKISKIANSRMAAMGAMMNKKVGKQSKKPRARG